MPPLGRRALEDPAALAAAFPSLAGGLGAPKQRRDLLRLMAASLALAGCDASAPGSAWVPPAVAPEGVVPGMANRFATSTQCGGAGLGLVVTHESGRPIKVEGNPLHPSSLGATDAPAQALVLDFYDPDRASGLLQKGRPAAEGRLLAALVPVRERLAAARGAGLRVLTGTVLSPTMGRALDQVLARYPEARWQQWEADGRDAARHGAALAYGRPLHAVPRPEAADVVIGLDSDLADGAPGWVRLARGVASRRNPVNGPPSTLIAVEAVPSALGTLADRRVAAGPAEMLAGLGAMAEMVLDGTPAEGPHWAKTAAERLAGASGRALLHAGPSLPPGAQALVHAVNERLGGRGRTFDLLPGPEHRADDQAAGLAALLDDMRAGRVEALLILGVNPVHTVPGFAEALARVPLSLHAGPAPDETALAAAWHLPLAHEFESWGDLRGHDGTVGLVQPQSRPLHGGRDALEVLALLAGTVADPRAAVRETWKHLLPDEDAWLSALADGIVPGTAQAPLDVTLRPEASRWRPAAGVPPAITLLFRPDPYLGDGRRANNGWLQELPRPFTKLTWDNPLLLSPSLARQHGLADGDVVALSRGARTVELPAMVLPGLAAGCAVATLGYGRESAGKVGSHVGTDLFPLRSASGEAILRPTGRRQDLATTDRGGGWAEHSDILRTTGLASFRGDPGKTGEAPPDNSLYRVKPQAPVAWGMSVDLNACIGCNACVAACTAENNVPVVGRDNVLNQREMHWLRIDRYWEGPPEEAQPALQPMLCMHCEEAPCETVCPVGASIHDGEGLNLQVYNRCIGTRFCSNNCPYKVRRFNFGPYAAEEARPPEARNPEVSVRARGVMEKCTFCVQRIAAARIAHDRDGTKEQTVTACQAACPTQVFTFGDLNDHEAEVVRRKRSPLDYTLLPEQQTHPRVTYEMRVRDRGAAG